MDETDGGVALAIGKRGGESFAEPIRKQVARPPGFYKTRGSRRGEAISSFNVRNRKLAYLNGRNRWRGSTGDRKKRGGKFCRTNQKTGCSPSGFLQNPGIQEG